MACNSSQNNNLPVLNLEGAITARIINNCPNIELESIIPLETSDKSLLSEIIKIVKAGDRLFILDTEGKLKVFNTKGEFLRNIGRQGQGPGEYPDLLTDFAVDSINKQVYIHSVTKFLTYDFAGNFKTERSIDNFNLQVFTLCNNKLFYIYPCKPHADNIKTVPMVAMFSLDGKKEKEFPAYRLRRGKGFPFFKNIASYKGNVFYKEELGQAIYIIKKDLTVDSLCLFNLGKYAFEVSHFDFSKKEIWKQYYRLQNILPANDFMIFILQKGLIGQNFYPFIWNKKDNTISKFHFKVTHKETEFSVLPFALTSNKIVGVLKPMPNEEYVTENNPVLAILKWSKEE